VHDGTLMRDHGAERYQTGLEQGWYRTGCYSRAFCTITERAAVGIGTNVFERLTLLHLYKLSVETHNTTASDTAHCAFPGVHNQ
jgi:hypothetical protein